MSGGSCTPAAVLRGLGFRDGDCVRFALVDSVGKELSMAGGLGISVSGHRYVQ